MIGALVGALVLALAGIAAAGSRNGVDFDLGYTTTKANSSTGFESEIDSTGTADSTGKPRAARKVTITFPRGTKFDTRVLPVCTREKLSEEGSAGCPRKSKVGSGSDEGVTGLSSIDPVAMTIEAFNARNAILFYVRGSGAVPVKLVLEGKLRGNRLAVNVPKLPQFTPFGEAILTKFAVEIDRASKGRGSRKRHYATTPSSCPKGSWTTTALFQYDDGRTTLRDTTACRKTKRSRR